MKTIRILDFESIESFLANTELEKIVQLAAGDGTWLVNYLKREYSRKRRDLAPDTIEAAEAAYVDGDRIERAEAMVARLLEEAPQAWATIKKVVPQISDEIIERDLERLEPMW